MRGKRCMPGMSAAAAEDCCGDRSQGSSFSVQTFDQSAKKRLSQAMGEICVYTSAAVPSSLYACMHAHRHSPLPTISVACGHSPLQSPSACGHEPWLKMRSPGSRASSLGRVCRSADLPSVTPPDQPSCRSGGASSLRADRRAAGRTPPWLDIHVWCLQTCGLPRSSVSDSDPSAAPHASPS